MNIPQIQITTTDIKIDRQIVDAKVNITQKQAELHIEQPAATLEINTTQPELQVDMSQFWRDVGLKKTGELISEFAQKGTQTALEGMSRRAGEGRQLLQGAGKGNGANTIKSIAMQNHGPKRPGPYNIQFIPSYGAIQIDVKPGTLDINAQPQQVKHDVTVNKPKFDYTPWKINSEMLQRPSVSIDVIG